MEGLEPLPRISHIQGQVSAKPCHMALGHYCGEIDECVLKSDESFVHIHVFSLSCSLDLDGGLRRRPQLIATKARHGEP